MELYICLLPPPPDSMPTLFPHLLCTCPPLTAPTLRETRMEFPDGAPLLLASR